MERAASLGSLAAMHALATDIAKEDIPRAIELLKRASDGGYRDAVFTHAQLCEQIGRIDEALEGYRRAGYDYRIDAGLVDYSRLLIDRKQFPEALKALNLAVEHRDPIGLYNYGRLRAEGKAGLDSDLQEAVKYIQMAADAGLTIACTKYGDALLKGMGVVRDPLMAVEYYQKAIQKGESVAMCNCAGIYLRGEGGVPKAETKGTELYRLAAEKGFLPAIFKFAECAEKGIGMEKDIETARRYYRAAADKNFEGAREALARLSSGS
jgi:TPR repeat protein